MILFPIALIWLVVVLVWIIRNSTGDLDGPAGGEGSRRFRPRGPRTQKPDGSRSARRKTARSA